MISRQVLVSSVLVSSPGKIPKQEMPKTTPCFKHGKGFVSRRYSSGGSGKLFLKP
jgi:hypothetical protein